MVTLASTPEKPAYAIPERAIRTWVTERLRRQPRAHGGVLYSFTLSGSTCNNMGVPLEVIMTVAVGADGRIEAATSRPAAADFGCRAMCAAQGDGRRFFGEVGGCEEAIGLTLEQAAFRQWEEEPSGCFCTPGNRRHKWRNVFQTLHYAATHER
jgi:hypothetical protein